MRPLHTKLALAFLATLAVRVAFHGLTGYTGDDAFITFRYAENLASGLGFVYNPGQPVLGTTTPLFTLLLALLHLLSVPIPTTALVISLIASGLTSVVLYKFAQSLNFGPLAWLPVLAYILWPRSLPVDTSGMETALFTMLVTAAFYVQFRQRDIPALVLASLAALTRPEGAAVVFILLAYNLCHHRERALKYALVTGALLLPWIAFATLYFGSPIQNSILAKATFFHQSTDFTMRDTLVYLMGWHTLFGWITTIIALLGAYWIIKKQRWGFLEIAWIGLLIAGYSLVRARIFPWYIAPIYPLYLLFITAAFCWLADRLRFLDKRRTAYAAVTGVALCATLISWDYQPVKYYMHVQQAYRQVHYEIGLYLHEHAGPDEWIAAQDIGYIGYYSKRRILDRDGLVSPEVIPYNRDGRHFDILADFAPDWAVISRGSPISTFAKDERFLNTYELKASFVADRFAYDIYQRRTPME